VSYIIYGVEFYHIACAIQPYSILFKYLIRQQDCPCEHKKTCMSTKAHTGSEDVHDRPIYQKKHWLL